MELKKENGNLPKIWIITKGHYAKYAFDSLGFGNGPVMAREYQISVLGRYLIAPKPINVKKQLVGCEVHFQPSALNRLRQRILSRLGKKNNGAKAPLTIIRDFVTQHQPLSNEELDIHFHAVFDKLSPFDTFIKRLNAIDLNKVDHISGLCRDDTGNQTPLTIEGAPDQQKEFVGKNAGKEINVRINRAHIAEGLFEMKGFDFKEYTSDESFKLIRFTHNGKSMACVLNSNNSIAFWLDDVKLIHYLQLFEYSIQHNHQMRQTLTQCLKGSVLPLKLLFNHSLAIDYRQAPLPSVFHEIVEEYAITDDASQMLKHNLNFHQIGISLNFIRKKGGGEGELCTHISVLQNLRALEPIKGHLPEVFEAITKKATHFDDGKFYLLETIRGVNNEA